MLTAREIIDIYISFYEKRGHKRIENAPLVPQNDPTTLFINSGMQPLVPYLLGEKHPEGKRLVDVQNCFRAQDIDEVGDNRHTTFFRMLGNWSLGDYFKEEQIPWFFEFLTQELRLPPDKLYVTVFQGFNDIPQDNVSGEIWKGLFETVGLNPKERISYYGAQKNWWSRAGTPENMPAGEPGGPSTEVFFDFETPHDSKFGKNCHINCDCGRYMEIGNSVFMQYIKQANGTLQELPNRNVDFGGGLERLLAATNNNPDVFTTNLFSPIVTAVEHTTGKTYTENAREIRIIINHFASAVFMACSNVKPSNKEQGYIMRRLIRRGFDGFSQLGGKAIEPILESIVEQYRTTDPKLVEQYEELKNTILEEAQNYKRGIENAKKFITKKYSKQGDELMGITEISAEDAFILYTTHGLSPTQIKSLGFSFKEQKFAEQMEQHQKLSKQGGEQKFKGGLADTQAKTIMGHTATHLMHQALRDMFGKQLHQTGSNITTERVRFDFNFDRKLTEEEILELERVVNEKIKQNIPVHFEMLETKKGHELGAIGLFMDTYGDKSKIYFIGGDSKHPRDSYSIEFCGGPHVDFTSKVGSFKIIKQENIGHGQRRLYATVGKPSS